VARLYGSSGSLVASNDPTNETYAVINTMVAAGTYYLHVTGTGVGNPESDPPTGYAQYGSLGQFVVSGTISEPPNDLFADATVLTAASGSLSGLNENASTEPGEPAHHGRGPFNSVWWSLAPAVDSLLDVDTHGSAFDTTLGIYTGGSVGDLTLVRSNDNDGVPNNNSGMEDVLLSAGITYHIAVDGYAADESGSIVLNWDYATAPSPSIEGFVRMANGYGVASASVSANSGGGSTTTDSSGHYSLSVPYGWSGRVSASAAGWSIDPPFNDYSSVTADKAGENYVATPATWISVRGTVSGAYGLNPGTAITAQPGAFSVSTPTATGAYDLQVPSGWTGTLTASRTGYSFSPPSIGFSSPVTSDQNGQDFVGSADSGIYVSGNVSGPGGMNPGVLISSTPGGYRTQTDSSGNYNLAIPSGWSGMVWPTKSGYAFNPLTKSYSNVTASDPGENYTGGSSTGWQSVGSGLPADMNVYFVRAHPNNINEVWIGGDWPSIVDGDVGLFKSTDGGSSWVPVTSGLTDPSDKNKGYGFAFMPGNPNTVYFCGVSGVFKSTNGGSSWFRPTVSGSLDLYDIASDVAFDPQNTSRVYIMSDYAFHRSTDGGSTWEEGKGYSSKPFFNIYRLSVDPNNSAYVYHLRGDGLWISDSYGTADSWTLLPNILDIAIDANSGVLYATDNHTDQKLMWSSDYGASWRSINYRDNERYLWGLATRLAVDPLLGTVFITTQNGSVYDGIIRASHTGPAPDDWEWVFEHYSEGWPLNYYGVYAFDCVRVGTTRRLYGHAESATEVLLRRDLGQVVEISGTVSGVGLNPGTSVYASHGGGAVRTPSGGDYSALYVPSGWSGSLSADKDGYVFEPGMRELSEVVTDTGGQDFNGSGMTVRVSGYLWTSTNTPFSGVQVNASGGVSETSDTNGFYAMFLAYGWTGTVTPSNAGSVFSPEARSLTDLTQDTSGQDFVADAVHIEVSGRITNQAGVAIADCLVEATPGAGTCLSDSEGRYSIAVGYGWGGDVTPSKRDLMFEPAIRTYPPLSQSVSNAHFEAHEVLRGSVLVSIYPSSAIDAGANWRLDHGSWQSSGTTLDGVIIGVHTVSYSTVSGFAQPADKAIAVMSNQTAVVVGAYADLYEADDGPAQANTISNGLAQTHSLHITNDQDWVLFSVDGITNIALETTGMAGDTRLWLFDHNTNAVAFDDDSGMGLFSHIGFTVTAGTYYAKVDEYNADQVVDSYDIALAFTTPHVDSDGDGLTDYEETLAGTDPRDVASCLQMRFPSSGAVPPDGQGLVVEWTSATNRHYNLMRSTNLLHQFDNAVATNIPATPSVNVHTDRTAVGRGPYFYQIRLDE